MDVLKTIYAIISVLADLCSILPVIAIALSKRRRLQNLLDNSSVSANQRQELEDRRNKLTIKMVAGILRGSLTAILVTVIVISGVNFYLMFAEHLRLMQAAATAGDGEQVRVLFDEVYSQTFSYMAEILSFSDPLSDAIGVVFGILLGAFTGLFALTERK